MKVKGMQQQGPWKIAVGVMVLFVCVAALVVVWGRRRTEAFDEPPPNNSGGPITLAIVAQKTENVGDDIQVLAMLRVLKSFATPRWTFENPDLAAVFGTLTPSGAPKPIDAPIVVKVFERDRIYAHAEPAIVIGCGWFTHQPKTWNVHPQHQVVFIGFHACQLFRDRIRASPELQAVFRKNAPVRCRDLSTMRFFESLAIPATFSGCVTMTLHDYQSDYESNIKHPVICTGSIQPACVKAPFLCNHCMNGILNYDERLYVAKQHLDTYASAGRIITDRLHTFVPSSAMGKPVEFTMNDPSRTEGLQDIMQGDRQGILDKAEAFRQTLHDALVAKL